MPVLMLGGFTSIPGAIVGGLIIGVGENCLNLRLVQSFAERPKTGLPMFLRSSFLSSVPKGSLVTKSSKVCDGMTYTNAYLLAGTTDSNL